MKLIRQKFEILEQPSGLEGIYKIIELAGRTCYKSYDKITYGSAKLFVDRMIKSGHGAMLEHGSVYLCIPVNVKCCDGERFDKYESNPYSKINIVLKSHGGKNGIAYISTNLRVMVENNLMDDIRYICQPTEYHEQRVTVLFTCDRVTGESFLRHRKIDEDQPTVEGEVTREMESDINSFARESTRYCNYTKEKFGGELTFVQPSEITDEDVEKTIEALGLPQGRNNDENLFRLMCTMIGDGDPEEDDKFGIVDTWLFAGLATEWVYNRLIRLGWKPQQARRKLTMDIKSPLVMTAFVSDWQHFFKLRAAPDAHPQAQELAYPLQEEFRKRGFIK